MIAESGLKIMTRQVDTFINLGELGVMIRFNSNNLCDYALKHLFLSKVFEKQILGEIDYIEDESTSDLIKASYPPNSIYIQKDKISEDQTMMLMRMFNQYTVSLNIRKGYTEVRYPSAMPNSYLLEDILQAALHPILEQIGGFILHGSCVAKDSNAIVLMGNSGSGKSTAAFNLTRFGFRCYADDAVVVTPNAHGLYVWPLDREISLRPLSFKIFEQQAAINYNKDERKYYFEHSKEDISGCGALLKFICFLELSGDDSTKIVELRREEALKKILKEDHHFSFVGRDKSDIFAKAIAENVPKHLSAFIGIDFESQHKAFEALFCGSRAADFKNKSAPAGRTEKMALIRDSWLSNGEEPLSELIPLLGDMDIKVTALATAFFRNYPLAYIEPIRRAAQKTVDLENLNNVPFSFNWLRIKEWASGSRELIVQSKKEVVENFAADWISAAPILYPFLSAAAYRDPDKYKFIENGWMQYQQKRLTNNLDNNIHISDFQSNEAFSITMLNEGMIKDLSQKGHVYIYYWLTQSDRKEWEALAKTLRSHKDVLTLTALPVDIGNNSPLTASAEFIEYMAANGIRPEISRLMPLCRLGEKNARVFFETGSFTGRTTDALVRSDTFSQIGVKWVESPFPECENCMITELGFCAGHLVKRGND